jgi:cell division protein FtsB
MLRESSWFKRVAQVVGLLVVLVLVFGFSQRMAEYTRLSNQQEREGARITELVATQSYLQDEIAYATSEAAVEEWARQDARLAQPGDFAVIPLAPPGATPQAPAAAEPTQEALSNWEVWFQWLFYAGP